VTNNVIIRRLTDFIADSGRPSGEQTLLNKGFNQTRHRWTRIDTDKISQGGGAASFGLRREAKRHAALGAVWRAKAVSPLRSATAIQNAFGL
jgi:hypothetical protein